MEAGQPGREQEGGALGLEERPELASLLTELDGAGEEGLEGGDSWVWGKKRRMQIPGY